MAAEVTPPSAGFALVSVLAVTALLSSLLLSLLLWSRNSVEDAAVATSDVRTDALLRSAIAVAVYQLSVLKLPPDRVSGQQLVLDGGTATLSIDDDSGKVDLNGSAPAVLAAAYRAAGLITMRPETFAARVVDWRDENDAADEGGSEAAAYRAAGLSPPRNAPFRSTSDLREVVGMSADDTAALAPLVTIFNPRGLLNPYIASPALIRNLPGVSSEALTQIFSLVSKPQSKANQEMLISTLNNQQYMFSVASLTPRRLSVSYKIDKIPMERKIAVWISDARSGQNPLQIFAVKYEWKF